MMKKMHKPSHPGLMIKEDLLPALGISVTQAAESLGVTRAAFSRVINGKAAISPEMAIRIEKWLGIKNGGSADIWLNQQATYDLWQARKQRAPKVKPVRIELGFALA